MVKVTSKHLFLVLYVCLGLSLAGGFWVHTYAAPHLYFPWQALPVFPALYGFFGCIVIILGSKALGYYWLQKREGYYEEDELKGEKKA